MPFDSNIFFPSFLRWAALCSSLGGSSKLCPSGLPWSTVAALFLASVSGSFVNESISLFCLGSILFFSFYFFSCFFLFSFLFSPAVGVTAALVPLYNAEVMKKKKKREKITEQSITFSFLYLPSGVFSLFFLLFSFLKLC